MAQVRSWSASNTFQMRSSGSPSRSGSPRSYVPPVDWFGTAPGDSLDLYLDPFRSCFLCLMRAASACRIAGPTTAASAVTALSIRSTVKRPKPSRGPITALGAIHVSVAIQAATWNGTQAAGSTGGCLAGQLLHGSVEVELLSLCHERLVPSAEGGAQIRLQAPMDLGLGSSGAGAAVAMLGAAFAELRHRPELEGVPGRRVLHPVAPFAVPAAGMPEPRERSPHSYPDGGIAAQSGTPEDGPEIVEALEPVGGVDAALGDTPSLG